MSVLGLLILGRYKEMELIRRTMGVVALFWLLVGCVTLFADSLDQRKHSR